MSILHDVSKTPAGSHSTLPSDDITARYFVKSGNWYPTLVYPQHAQPCIANIPSDTHFEVIHPVLATTLCLK